VANAGAPSLQPAEALAIDRPGVEFDAEGHVDVDAVRGLGVPSGAGFYLCGPRWLRARPDGRAAALGVPADRIRVEIFGPRHPITRDIGDEVDEEAGR
jgi:ferredoxin-NADP reductase